ncbi:MAG: hypothetical protein RMN52_09985 [Anaerolineae bacterium]|nr:hypothetical protein [Candidatus Roseilinea sp.]MDW8450323.1 hypothetical protein [Anaerolineae bacterium]
MNLLKRLFGGAAKSEVAPQDSDALIYYVKGHKCGAITRVRIDRRNDLSRDDDDNFFVRKVVVDSKCYGQVELELRFDPQYNEISREIKGGVFVTRQEWEAQEAEKRRP